MQDLNCKLHYNHHIEVMILLQIPSLSLAVMAHGCQVCPPLQYCSPVSDLEGVWLGLVAQRDGLHDADVLQGDAPLLLLLGRVGAVEVRQVGPRQHEPTLSAFVE